MMPLCVERSAGTRGGDRETFGSIPSHPKRGCARLAPPKPRRLDEPIAVSLEDLVPAKHSYRHLETHMDLSFVRIGHMSATPSEDDRASTP
jgi:hypothetical protein